jgi:hypothetical protein
MAQRRRLAPSECKVQAVHTVRRKYSVCSVQLTFRTGLINSGVPCFLLQLGQITSIAPNGWPHSLVELVIYRVERKVLRFRRDSVSISYTVICLSHFDVCLAIT